MAIKVTKYYDDIYKNRVQSTTDLANQQKNQVNQKYDAQIAKYENDANRQIVSAGNSYDAAYSDNAVQQAINERSIRESMAGSGLNDSGLNRTQTTALYLQKANADNAVTMQKNSFINKVRSALSDNKYTAEQSRTDSLNQIDNQLKSDINTINDEKAQAIAAKNEEIISTLQSITDPTTAAGYIKTVSREYGVDPNTLASYSSVVTKNSYAKYLKNEKYFKQQDEKSAIKSTLSGIDTTTAAGQSLAAKQISTYVNSHKNVTKSQIKKLCASAGISYTDYNKYLKDKNYFVDKENKKTDERDLRMTEAKLRLNNKYSKSGSSGGKGGGGSKGSGGSSSSKSTSSSVDVSIDDDDDGKKIDDNGNNSGIKITKKYPTIFQNRGIFGAFEEFNRLDTAGKISDKNYKKVLSAIKNAYKGSLTENDKKLVKKKYGYDI